MTALANLAAYSPFESDGSAERQRLADIVYDRSFGRGKIVLSSGKESDFYFDMKPSMLDPEGASLIAKQILAEVKAVDGEYIGGMEMSAVAITGAVCQHSYEQGTPVHGFFVRKEAKAHGARKKIEGLSKGESLKGKRVVVVDDVTTSGDSALKAVEACIEAGAQVVLVISIVDREDGAAESFKARDIPFKALLAASEFLTR